MNTPPRPLHLRFPDHAQAALLLVIALLCALSLVLPAHAQDGGEAYVEQAALSRAEAEQLVAERLSPRGQALLSDYRARSGAARGHFAFAAQQGAGNQAALEQQGTAHLAALAQTGAGNTTRLLQHGHGHVYGAWLRGEGNAVDVEQQGTGNVYLLDFAGDGLRHTARQIGANLQAVQLGQNSVPFGIEQRGAGQRLVVRHNGAAP